MNIRRMLVRGAIRSTFYRMSAIYWRARTFGRISGTSFRIIHPERLIVSRHGRLEIGQGTVIDFGARLIVHGYLRLGERVYVGRDAVISMAESVSIGAGTRIAERVSIHERNYAGAGDWGANQIRSSPIEIGEDCWLGANVVLTAGAVLGNRVTVGAHAVVTGPIPAGATAVGIPARVVKTR
jgi:acetyltransferase-like isoleucine patch superfamily enzyme